MGPRDSNRVITSKGSPNFSDHLRSRLLSPPTFSRLEMGKHTRKRQKTEKLAHELVQPLGTRVSLTDEASKDDEERRLESLLFGVPFVPSGTDNNILAVSYGKEGEEGITGHGKELENMLDTDVSSH